MNQIDFLPESFRRRQRRRGRLIRQIVAVFAVAAVLAGTAVLMRGHSRGLQATAQRLEDTVDTERGSLGMLAMLQRERDQLEKQVELQRELTPEVSYSQVLAALTRSLPPGVAIRELTLRTVYPKPEPIETDAEREARLAKSNRQRTQKIPATVEPYLIGIEFRGVSPTDMAVATLIATLDDDPLFSRVTMRSSRGVERQNLRLREFTLTATVDLDRHFEWTPPIQELADAHR